MKRIFLYSLTLLASVQFNMAQTLEETARHKIELLKSLIVEAEQKSMDPYKEKMTLRTAELFLDYANWDEENYDIIFGCFDEKYWYRAYAEELATGLPDKERRDVTRMLDEAIERLVYMTDSIHSRLPIPRIDHAEISFDQDQLIHEGRPVFLHDYMLEPKDVPLLNEFYGDYDGEYISPSNIDNALGEIKSGVTNRLRNNPDGNIGQVWVDNKNIPQWAKDKYGFLPPDDYSEGNRIFTKYDIDNPGAREMMEYLFEGTVPLMADKNYTKLGYMTMNEPHFNTAADTWETGGVSEYTKEKFRVWLSSKHASVGELNTLWGTGFENFDSVKVTIPMDLNLQGTPMWYDWMKFNQYRVTQWFIFMRDEILKHDPTAKVHFKVMPRFFAENWRSQGLDFEAIARLCHISGNDAGAHYYNKYRNKKFYDDQRYSFYWQETAMTYDFFRSVEPDQIIYNSEVHYDSHDPDVDPDYIRAIYWLAHLHGLNASLTWTWVRDADGSVNPRWTQYFAGTYSQNPLAVEYLAGTFMDLNSHAEIIAGYQQQARPLRIYYSETSAINKPSHIDDVFEIYETLYYDGLALGYATDSMIREGNTGEWEVMVIHKTPYVTQKEQDGIRTFLDSGGTVVMDSESLAMDEYGNPLAILDQGDGTIIYAASAGEMRTQALQILGQKGLLPEVSISEINSGSGKACIWKCLKGSNGNNVVSIVNVGNSDAQLTIELKNAATGTTCTNLFTGAQVSSLPTLKPFEVYLIEVADAEDTTTAQLPSIRFDDPTVYETTEYPNDRLMDIILYYDAGTGENVMEGDWNGITCKLFELDEGGNEVHVYTGSYSTAIGRNSGVANISIDITGATPTDSLEAGHYYELVPVFRSTKDDGTDILMNPALTGLKIINPMAAPSLQFDDSWKYQSNDILKIGPLTVLLDYSAGIGDTVTGNITCRLIEKDGSHNVVREYVASDTTTIGNSTGTAVVKIDISQAITSDSLTEGHYYLLSAVFRSSRNGGTDIHADSLTGITIATYEVFAVPSIWMDDREKYLTTEYINEGTMELYVYYDAGEGHAVMDGRWRGITGQLVEKDETGKGIAWYKSSDLSTIGTSRGLAHITINIDGVTPTADLDEGHFYALVPLINSTYNPDKLYYLNQRLEGIVVVNPPGFRDPSISVDDRTKYQTTEYPNTGILEVVINYDAGSGDTVVADPWKGITCKLIEKDESHTDVIEYTGIDSTAIGENLGTAHVAIDITGATPTDSLDSGHYYALVTLFRSSRDPGMDLYPDEPLTGIMVIDTTTTTDTTTSIKPAWTGSGLRVYPNPATEKIYLQREIQNKQVDVTIYNLQGKMLLRKTCISEVDISALPEGMYILEINNFRSVFVKRRE